LYTDIRFVGSLVEWFSWLFSYLCYTL